MMFDDKHLEMARAHLLGDGSAELIRLMQCKSLLGDISGFSEESVQAVRMLNWASGPDLELTDLGVCAADSCREYQFWQDRKKELPFEGAAAHLSVDFFKGKSVIEIGSGMGANLMALSAVTSKVCGVEPVKAYAQLGGILCEREGIQPPEVRQGSAEALPFEDNEADLILCVSAHQYFDICPAFTEISRVLKPGGELIIVGGTLKGYLGDGLKGLRQRRNSLKSVALTTLNTLSYMLFKRRLIVGRGAFSTSRPIYPTRSAMKHWLSDAGFTEVSPMCKVGSETCFHMRQSA